MLKLHSACVPLIHSRYISLDGGKAVSLLQSQSVSPSQCGLLNVHLSLARAVSCGQPYS